jgi:hypothetical protein
MKFHPEELPVTVAGIDWRNLEKGQIIPEYKVVEIITRSELKIG